MLWRSGYAMSQWLCYDAVTMLWRSGYAMSQWLCRSGYVAVAMLCHSGYVVVAMAQWLCYDTVALPMVMWMRTFSHCHLLCLLVGVKFKLLNSFKKSEEIFCLRLFFNDKPQTKCVFVHVCMCVCHMQCPQLSYLKDLLLHEDLFLLLNEK